MHIDWKNGEKLVGIKQTKKAVKDGRALTVYIAQDAEAKVREPLVQLCRETGTEFVMVPTMKELGEACGIQVGAATAASCR